MEQEAIGKNRPPFPLWTTTTKGIRYIRYQKCIKAEGKRLWNCGPYSRLHEKASFSDYKPHMTSLHTDHWEPQPPFQQAALSAAPLPFIHTSIFTPYIH